MPPDRRHHTPDTLDTQSQSVRRAFDPGIPPPTQFSTSLPVICAVEEVINETLSLAQVGTLYSTQVALTDNLFSPIPTLL